MAGGPMTFGDYGLPGRLAVAEAEVTRLRAELASVTEDRDSEERWANQYKAERDQAVKERDRAFAHSRESLDAFDSCLAQRDQALRLITQPIDTVWPWEDWQKRQAWALRASDPKQPWPTDAETAAILGGGG